MYKLLKQELVTYKYNKIHIAKSQYRYDFYGKGKREEVNEVKRAKELLKWNKTTFLTKTKSAVCVKQRKSCGKSEKEKEGKSEKRKQ